MDIRGRHTRAAVGKGCEKAGPAPPFLEFAFFRVQPENVLLNNSTDES
jgi:hypothetical protein